MILFNMSRKHKNIIDIKKSLEILVDGYGLIVEELNFYQFRIRHEEHRNVFFDWYHTTGSFVICENGYNKAIYPKRMNAEDVAIYITKYFD